MTLILKDRVRETTITTGTGSLTLAGAVTGFRTFSSAIGNGNTTYYAISRTGSSEWEIGLGTVSSGALSRDTVIDSSNSGALVNFSAGTKDVYCSFPAKYAGGSDGASWGAGSGPYALNIPFAQGDAILLTIFIGNSSDSYWYGVVKYNLNLNALELGAGLWMSGSSFDISGGLLRIYTGSSTGGINAKWTWTRLFGPLT